MKITDPSSLDTMKWRKLDEGLYALGPFIGGYGHPDHHAITVETERVRLNPNVVGDKAMVTEYRLGISCDAFGETGDRKQFQARRALDQAKAEAVVMAKNAIRQGHTFNVH